MVPRVDYHCACGDAQPPLEGAQQGLVHTQVPEPLQGDLELTLGSCNSHTLHRIDHIHSPHDINHTVLPALLCCWLLDHLWFIAPLTEQGPAPQTGLHPHTRDKVVLLGVASLQGAEDRQAAQVTGSIMEATHKCQHVTQLHKIKAIINTAHVYKYMHWKRTWPVCHTHFSPSSISCGDVIGQPGVGRTAHI